MRRVLHLRTEHVADDRPDSRLDLWERKLKEQSRKLRQKAGQIIPRGLRTPKGSMLLLDDDDGDGDDTLSVRDKDAKRKMLSTVYRQDVEREVQRIKGILNTKINTMSAKWKSAKVVRTREKICELGRGVRTGHGDEEEEEEGLTHTRSVRVRRAHRRVHGLPARPLARVDPGRVHDPGRVPPYHPRVHVQEARVALLPVR